jgi:hypothetical protein
MALLGYWFQYGPAQSMNNDSRDTRTVGKTARRTHISHVSISVAIQLRLALRVLLFTFLSPET